MTSAQPAPPIVHTPLPLYAVQLPVSGFLAALALALGAATVAQSMTVGLFAFAISAVLGLLYRRSILRRLPGPAGTEYPADSAEITFSPELRRVVADLLPPVIVRTEKHRAQRWNDFQAQCQRLGIPRPRTVMDSTLAGRLGAIDRPDFSMEPAPILGSGDARSGMNWLWPLGFSVGGATALFVGEVLPALMLFAFAGFWLVTTVPSIRDRFRIFRWDDGNIVAGMGSLRDQRNRVWTTDNAVMIVQTNNSAGGVFVRFIGEPGETDLTFTDETDPDFQRLWQRWNHPTPRPELEFS